MLPTRRNFNAFGFFRQKTIHSKYVTGTAVAGYCSVIGNQLSVIALLLMTDYCSPFTARFTGEAHRRVQGQNLPRFQPMAQLSTLIP